ncbi:hypothetical protein VU549_02640 [Enterobacter hormaechei]|uniref:hypothetical protein n=1 Tax=Enterobacter hormaechei TaxID=158836 RepID=UPI003CF5001F
MSNIDKHAVQAVADLKAGYTLGNADVAILNELARIALASIEAELCTSYVSDAELNAALLLHRLKVDGHSQLSDAFRTGFKYARRTSLPAPVVPDFGALTKCIVQRLVDYGAADDDAIASAEEFVYNACRATMLQGADGNSQVIPDGWALVPIEPTEDMIVNGFESEPDESFSDEKEWEA